MRALKNLIGRQVGRRYPFMHSPGSYKLPAYEHDQCERSLHMHLFSLEKRDVTLLLVLVISFSAFCMMVTSLAPKSHVLDTVLLGGSLVQLRENHKETDERYYLIHDEDGAYSRNGNQAIEMRMITKPLNTLNRAMTFMLRAEFDLSLDNYVALIPATIFNNSDSNEDAQFLMIGSYRIEWILEPLKLAACRYDNEKCERELKNASLETNFGHEQEDKTKHRGMESLSVMFCCSESTMLPQPNLKSIPAQAPVESGRSNRSLLRCRAPELSFSRRIHDLKRDRYRLAMSINNISFSPQNRTPVTKTIDETALGDIKLLVPESARLAVTLSYTNSSFTFLTIFVHLFFLLISLCVACCFILCLAKYPLQLCSLEQKWTALLLVLLVGANRPLYTLEFLGGFQRPMQSQPAEFGRQDENSPEQTIPAEQTTGSASSPVISNRNHFDLLDSILDLTFVCGLLLSWICFAHSIRQMSRPFWRFYGPKLAIVGAIWLISIMELFLAAANQLKWHSPELQSNQTRLKLVFYSVMICYFVSLTYHFTCTAIELKPMSYFIVRYRIQTTLCIMILLNYMTIVLLVPPFHISEPLSQQQGKPLFSMANLSNSNQDSAPNVRRPSASQQVYFYGSAEQEPPGAPSEKPNGFMESVSRWKVDATDSVQWSLLDLLPQSHALDSACSFLCYVMVNNLYVLVCAYLYWPVVCPVPIPCKLLSSANKDDNNTDKNIESTMADSE